jgi:hypothetical protein
VEFAVIAITFLFVILGVIQLAMVLNANSLLRLAAYNAARAAIVHSGDIERMREAARISLLPIFPRHGRADHARGLVENYLGARATDNSAAFSALAEPITRVSILDQVPCGTVVTFDDPVEAANAIITVQVVHYYELVIPLVNRIIYFVYNRLVTGEGYQGETIDRLAALTDKERRSGFLRDIEYRIPLVQHYTMRLQSDYIACSDAP